MRWIALLLAAASMPAAAEDEFWEWFAAREQAKTQAAQHDELMGALRARSQPQAAAPVIIIIDGGGTGYTSTRSAPADVDVDAILRAHKLSPEVLRSVGLPPE